MTRRKYTLQCFVPITRTHITYYCLSEKAGIILIHIIIHVAVVIVYVGSNSRRLSLGTTLIVILKGGNFTLVMIL